MSALEAAQAELVELLGLPAGTVLRPDLWGDGRGGIHVYEAALALGWQPFVGACDAATVHLVERAGVRLRLWFEGDELGFSD